MTLIVYIELGQHAVDLGSNLINLSVFSSVRRKDLDPFVYTENSVVK